MRLDRRLLRLALGHRLLLVSTIELGAVVNGAAALQAGILSRVIAGVFLEHLTPADVSGLLYWLLVFIAARLLLTWGGGAAGIRLARRVKDDLRLRLAHRMLDLGPLHLRLPAGEVETLAIEGIDALDPYFAQYLPGLAQAALSPLIFLAFVFPIDPLSGVILLVTAPLIPLFMVLIGSWAQALTRRQFVRLSRMSAYFLDVLQGLATLKMFGRSREQAEVVFQMSDRYRKTTMGVLQVAFLSALALEMIATLSTAVIAVSIGLRLLYGWVEFAPALFVLILAPEYYAPLRQLGARFHAGMSGVEAAHKLFALLEPGDGSALSKNHLRPSAGSADKSFSRLHVNIPLHPPEIVLQNISFTYPGSPAPALKDVSFTLSAGGITVLMGPSGGGKSTLAALLLRFGEPSGGVILVNGQDLSTLPPATWREQVAWLPQHPYLFPGTVAENIRLAYPEAPPEAVVDAARQAGADAFIRALPQGYDTPLGERGARLSAGQAARLALARAFLRPALLVILDEPTAHLDPENAAHIEQAIVRLAQDRTVLWIAHHTGHLGFAHQVVRLGGEMPEASSPSPVFAPSSPLGVRVLTSPLLLTGSPSSTPGPSFPQTGSPSEPFPELEPRGEPGPPLPYSGEGPGGEGETLAVAHTFSALLTLLRPFAGLALLAVLAGAATVLSGVGLLFASAYILSAAALHPSIAELQVAIVGVRFFGISRGLFRYLERYLSHQSTFKLLAELRVKVYRALEPLAPARLMAHHSGDLLARLVGDVAALENFYVRGIAPPAAAILSGLAVGVLLGSFDLRLALIWWAVLLAGGVILPLLALHWSRQPGSRLPALRGDLTTAWVEGLNGLPDLLGLNAGARWIKQVSRLGSDWSATHERLARLGELQSAIAGGLGHLGMWGVLAASIPLVAAGELNGVWLAPLALAALAGLEAAAPLPAAAQTLRTSLASARRLFEIGPVDSDQTKIRLSKANQSRRIRRKSKTPRNFKKYLSYPLCPRAFVLKMVRYKRPPVIEFNHVYFRYPETATPWTLQDITFRLPPGGRLAILGASGAGKSTLVGLLLGFWKPQYGRILLGGRDARFLDPESRRSRLAVAPQLVHTFNATVLDNLRLAWPRASMDDVIAAARQVGLHDRIERLEQGYQTWLGEGGVQFSGGEQRRLGLARALLRLQAGAQVLILDEPTTHLDPQSERQVMGAILRAAEDRAIILITHRPVALDAMDDWIRIETGRVIALDARVD